MLSRQFLGLTDDADRRDRSRERDDDRRKARKRNWDVGADGQTVAPGGFSDAPPGAMMMQQQMMQQMQAQQMNTVLQQQAAVTRRARRLHIGNLPPGLNPAALRELFNDTMKAAKLTLDEEPCVNDVSMNPGPDTKFAFLEFRSAAETNNAMNLDGMQLLGKNIKVSRPNDFMPAPPELLSQIIPAQISATVTSNNPINVPMSGIARPNLPTGVLNPTLNPASVAAAGGVYTCETGSAAAAARTTHTTTNSAAQPPPPPTLMARRTLMASRGTGSRHRPAVPSSSQFSHLTPMGGARPHRLGGVSRRGTAALQT